MKSVFKEYLTNGIVQADTATLAKMCAYFIFYGIPYPIDDKSICKFVQTLYVFHTCTDKNIFYFPCFFLVSPVTTTQCTSGIPNVTLYKLRKILQTV